MTPEERAKALRLFRQNHLVKISLFIVLVMIACAILAPVLPLAHPEQQNFMRVLRPPFWIEGGSLANPLGTDFLGRDILSRVVFGAQISIGVGFAAVAVAAAIGVSFGIIAPYFGRWVDEGIMRVFDIILSIPHLLITIAVLIVFGQNLFIIILVLGIRSTVWYARTLRSRVLSVREEQYVKAARALGVGHVTIMLRHILKNSLSPILVLTSIYVGLMIIIESSLSFLGLTKGFISWGYMVAESRTYFATSWWTATVPGLCIVFIVLAMNIIGDFLRDVFDPRLQATGS